MIVKARSRGNGSQLANYLLNSKENDKAILMEIRGTTQTKDLGRALTEMSMSSKLTKRGEKGLYHAQINPAIGEDSRMAEKDWLKAADILEKELGFVGQNRAIVLHQKKGRTHSHIVWERYDHNTGKLRTDSFNFKIHDKARGEIEQALGHERTPQKKDRKREVDHKKELTNLWEQYPNCENFVKAAKQKGFEIGVRDDRRPYRAITPDGQDLDLVRQLKGINVKEVKNRLAPILGDLATEAELLHLMKTKSELVQFSVINRDNVQEKNLQHFTESITTDKLNLPPVFPISEINSVAQERLRDKEIRRLKIFRELQEKQRQPEIERNRFER